MEENNLKRRNISGIYIFDTFPTDEKPTPTCVEDCQQKTRRDWCATKSPEYLIECSEVLAKTFKELSNNLFERGDITKFSRDSFIELIDIKKPKRRMSSRDLTDTIDYLSKKITTLADSFGVTMELK